MNKVQLSHSKTTFVTVNQPLQVYKYIRYINSKTTFVTVNPSNIHLSRGGIEIQKQLLLLLIPRF